jgi:hypothetical protein
MPTVGNGTAQQSPMPSSQLSTLSPDQRMKGTQVSSEHTRLHLVLLDNRTELLCIDAFYTLL